MCESSVRPEGTSRRPPETIINSSGWGLPFHWDATGMVDSSVAKVTATFGGRADEAVLDRVRFMAWTGRRIAGPSYQGFDANGDVARGSDRDRSWEKVAQ